MTPKERVLKKYPHACVKVVGSNGQISLGKEFAGRQVLIEEKAMGVWLVRTAMVVPENEIWLHQPQAREELQGALEWAQRNPPKLDRNTKDK